MRVVAYSIRSYEKELLAKANQKKHDITLISNRLSLETVSYAAGKDAILVFTNDDVSAPVIDKLADLGIKYIGTRSVGTDHIDREAAGKRGMKIANVPSYSPQAIAEHAITLALALSRKLIPTVDQSRIFDFRIENHVGFNLYGKTVGLIGLGHIGQAAAAIFKGMGCRVLGHDIDYPQNLAGVEPVTLNELLQKADIISLHLPLTSENQYLINQETLSLMKNGTMLINTARGGLVKTAEVISALESGKLGYFGTDVYEFEKGLFFSDHRSDIIKDPILFKLMSLPNVIVTPHQAFLTQEALNQIAAQTISNLDKWHQNKCVGKACACAKQCKVPSELLNP